MANKNKKIRRLVKSRDHQRPSEFELIPTLTEPFSAPAFAAETGEPTYDIDDARTASAGKSNGELRALLEDRMQDIEELEFQLEQSRSRQRGLEEELRVREEITGTINEDIRIAQQQLMGAAGELESLNREYLALRAAFIEANERTQALRVEADRSRDMTALQEQRIAGLELELDASKSELSDLRGYISGRKRNWADQEQELAGIREDLAAAVGRLRELSELLDVEKSRNQNLQAAREALREEFDREVRQIRFELSNAQETIADQETLNEQLASDLIDNQQFRQALEAHLGEVETENEKVVQNLKRQLQKAYKDIDECERKLQIKDSAIADLMHELANQGSHMDFRDDMENVLQKIDGFRPASDPAGRRAERDRIARLLVGSADGKELRFPLFRDRLTIGRTTHNDIQLDLRYVSRRHAVIATDNNRTRIIDWGSRNGVYVNRKRVTEKLLSSGDVITIGVTNLRYEERPKR